MKIFKIVFFLNFLLFINSCGDETTNDSGLSASVSGTPYLFPSSGKGCLGEDLEYETVSKSYFTIPSLNINWTKQNYNLIIAYIKIELKGSGLSSDYSVALDGDDIDEKLVYLNDTAQSTTIVSGTIPGPTTAMPTRSIIALESCSLKFGGVSIADENKNFTANATITIQGIAVGNLASTTGVTGNLGEELPVKASAKFKVQFSQN
jgi:hypothetical protein